MPIAYEAGQEIQFDLNHKVKFFGKAKSWRDQKKLDDETEALKQSGTERDQADAALVLLVREVVRTEPEMEISTESLEQVLDYRQIWDLIVSVKYNLTFEDKKKLD